MAWGIGDGDSVQNFGTVEGWQGAPNDGVDVLDHALVPESWHAAIPSDSYLFLVILGSLVALWILGGTVFRRVRM
jgi:hypothetical protein